MAAIAAIVAAVSAIISILDQISSGLGYPRRDQPPGGGGEPDLRLAAQVHPVYSLKKGPILQGSAKFQQTPVIWGAPYVNEKGPANGPGHKGQMGIEAICRGNPTYWVKPRFRLPSILERIKGFRNLGIF